MTAGTRRGSGGPGPPSAEAETRAGSGPVVAQPGPWLGSVEGRLTLLSLGAWAGAAALLAAVLSGAFAASLERSAAAQLRLLTSMLLAATELRDGRPEVVAPLREPAFAQPGSGIYGLLLDGRGRVLWRSDSLLGTRGVEARLRSLPDLDPGRRYFMTTGSMYLAAVRVRYARDGNGGAGEGSAAPVPAPVPATAVVLASRAPFRAEVRAFATTLYAGLGGAVLVIGLVQVLVLRRGLAPLRAMARDVRAIEAGRRRRLDGPYPAELERLADNLNLLIDHEARQRDAYRSALGDLAHNLKTPLAVLRSALEADRGAGDDQGLLRDQVERMDQLVRLQLQRAAPAANALRARTRLDACIDGITRAVAKAFPERGLTVDTRLGVDAWPVDEGDLYEIVGNLVENAAKYGGGRIRVSTARTGGRLELRVEDDGPGIPPGWRAAVFGRGLRPDAEAREADGQGLGLAIVRERVRAYGGSIEVEDSDLGGAAFVVRL